MSLEAKIDQLTKCVHSLDKTMQQFVAVMTQQPLTPEPEPEPEQPKKKRKPINKSSLPEAPVVTYDAPDDLTHETLKDAILTLVRKDVSRSDEYKKVINGFRGKDDLPCLKVFDLKSEDLAQCWQAVHEL